MKTLKKFLPLAAFVLGIGLVFTQSAFKNARTEIMYQFEDNTDTNIDDPTHWRNLDEEPSLECSEGTTLPCVVKFDTTQYADIDAFLTAYPTRAAILESDYVESKKQLVNP